jgi:hypothetical protein
LAKHPAACGDLALLPLLPLTALAALAARGEQSALGK